MVFWIDFENHPSSCVEAPNKDAALALAQELTGKKATKVRSLPYPASPRLNEVPHPKYGPCPSFCFDPKNCAGRTSCPKSYACSE